LAETPYFVANEGQWEGDFQFKCEVGSVVYYVTPEGMTVDFREFKRYPKPRDPRDPLDVLERHEERDSVTVSGHVVQIHYVVPHQSSGGARVGQAVGQNKLSHYSNYFFGRDSANWRSRVGHYERVVVPEVWPGIDVEYRADKLGVETVYHVKPGADPTQIQMEYLGLDAPLRVDSQGNLILPTSLGEMKETAPYSYQVDGSLQRVVVSRYQVDGAMVGVSVSEYDRRKTLVIDPILYGTYLGGGETDRIEDIAFGSDSSIYVAGNSTSQLADSFPVTPGAYQIDHAWSWNAPFVVKLNAAGDSVIWGSFINASLCHIRGVEVTSRGEPVLIAACQGNSENWPLTANALDTVKENYEYGIAQFSADGAGLLFSTYLGGPSLDIARDAVMDEEDRLWVCGSVSLGFPTTPDAMYPDRIGGGDAGISIIDLNSYSLHYSTFWGGGDAQTADDPYSIQLIGNGVVAMCGSVYSNVSFSDLPTTENAFQLTWRGGRHDGFFAILNIPTATTEYCTFIGGNESDFVSAMHTPFEGVWALTGLTGSTNFPLTAGVVDTVIEAGPQGTIDAFALLLELPNILLASTFLGGLNYDIPQDVWATETSISIAGWTESHNFPVTPNGFDTVYNDNGLPHIFGDYFISRLNWSMTELQYSSFFGGFHTENLGTVKFENDNIVWLVGETGSTNLPTTPDSWSPTPRPGSEGFIFRFAIDSIPTVAPQCTLTVDNLSIVVIGDDVRLRWRPARMAQDTCNLPEEIGYAVFHAGDSQGPYLYLNHTAQRTLTHYGAVRHSPQQFYVVLAFDATTGSATPQIQELRKKELYLSDGSPINQ